MLNHQVINGVDVDELANKAKQLKKQPELAQFRFIAQNHWLEGGHNHTTISRFEGTGETHQHARPFDLHADEPPVLLGQDQGANPVEHLLNALASCLTTSMVYHAAVRGIHITEVESTIEGELDVRGFMGLAPEVRKGYQNITVKYRVKSDASKEKLEECAKFSPVFDVVTNGTNVDLQIEPA